MSVYASYDGIPINALVNFTFSGSSSPMMFNFPNCTGTLLKPSGRKEVTITLLSQLFPIKSKTEIEACQHELNEFLILKGNKTLVVDSIAYTNVTPLSVQQNVLTTKEYVSYSITFQLDYLQALFKPTINDGRVRSAIFSGYDPDNLACEFPVFDNFEAAMNVTYGQRVYPRVPYDTDIRRVAVQGLESINLDCWMVNQTSRVFQMYMSDFCTGPLGRIGTLNLNGNIYENAILVGVNSNVNIAQTLTYNLQFHATLAC